MMMMMMMMAVKGTQMRMNRRLATARFRISMFVVFFIWGFACTWKSAMRVFQIQDSLVK